jgi:hypothetical protein
MRRQWLPTTLDLYVDSLGCWWVEGQRAHLYALGQAVRPRPVPLLEHHNLLAHRHRPQPWRPLPTPDAGGHALAGALLDLFSPGALQQGAQAWALGRAVLGAQALRRCLEVLLLWVVVRGTHVEREVGSAGQRRRGQRLQGAGKGCAVRPRWVQVSAACWRPGAVRRHTAPPSEWLTRWPAASCAAASAASAHARQGACKLVDSRCSTPAVITMRV